MMSSLDAEVRLVEMLRLFSFLDPDIYTWGSQTWLGWGASKYKINKPINHEVKGAEEVCAPLLEKGGEEFLVPGQRFNANVTSHCCMAGGSGWQDLSSLRKSMSLRSLPVCALWPALCAAMPKRRVRLPNSPDGGMGWRVGWTAKMCAFPLGHIRFLWWLCWHSIGMILPGLDLDGLFNEAGGGKDISEAVSWQWEISVAPSWCLR